MTVATAGSCSSNSAPSLGISTYRWWDPKKSPPPMHHKYTKLPWKGPGIRRSVRDPHRFSLHIWFILLCLQTSFHFFFFFFLNCHTCGIWNFPGEGLNRSCSCWLQPQPRQHWIRAASVTYTAACSSAGSLTHWVRSGIKPTSSWTLCRILNPLSHSRNSHFLTFVAGERWPPMPLGFLVPSF